VHDSLYVDEGSGYGVTYAHLTWCGVNVTERWVLADGEPLSCFYCLTEALNQFSSYTEPGIAIVNTQALGKLNFPT
jgi:hypothetical protein